MELNQPDFSPVTVVKMLTNLTDHLHPLIEVVAPLFVENEEANELVEAIDLLPTFVDYAGGTPKYEILEGRSLKPMMLGKPNTSREYVISEYDYCFKSARKTLDQPIGDCRLAMIYDGRFKLIHAEGFRPMLFDLQNDPNEMVDLGNDAGCDAGCADTIQRLMGKLNAWYRQHHNKTMTSDAEVTKRENGDLRRGIYLGFWDQADMD